MASFYQRSPGGQIAPSSVDMNNIDATVPPVSHALTLSNQREAVPPNFGQTDAAT